MDHLGQQFGSYRLLRLLGQGGFARVYLGEHIHLGTLVAVKVLNNKLITREQNEFLQEARLIASLDHPSIVHVIDCGIERDEPFLIMNYAPNGTMRQKTPKGSRLELTEVVQAVKQIASALQYAHGRKLIHRDVKPENILLGPQEELLLGDFGIALISSSTASQSAKAAAGTVSYMAPEQIMGKPRTASDQYALGIMVYEWLCGEQPFHGSFSEVSAQHLHAPPPPFAEKQVSINPLVEEVVMKALAKKPEERYNNVEEFSNKLEEAAQQTILPTLLPEVAEETTLKPLLDETTDKRPPAEKQGVQTISAAPQQASRRKIPLLIGSALLLLLLIITIPQLTNAIATSFAKTTSKHGLVAQAFNKHKFSTPQALPTSTALPTVRPTRTPRPLLQRAPTQVPTDVPTNAPVVAPTSPPPTTPPPTPTPTLVPTPTPTPRPTPTPTPTNTVHLTQCGNNLITPWVALYQYSNYGGQQICFSGIGLINLANYGFSAQTQCINIGANGTFFDQSGGQGAQLGFYYGDEHADLGTWDNRIVSFVITG